MSEIHFSGHFEATRKRIRRLRDEGYIAERPTQRGAQSIFLITRRGFEILVSRGQLALYPNMSWPATARRAQVSDLTLRHELLVLDVKAAFFAAARYRPSLNFTQFSTWPRSFEFNVFHPATGEKVLVKPDGFIQLSETKSNFRVKDQYFFLEVDRSTETLATLIKRVTCYFEHYKCGGFAAHLGHGSESYKKFPFRVLIVCKSGLRRDNIAKTLITMNTAMRNFAWLTTIDEIIADPFQHIWLTPADYNGTAGSAKPRGLLGF
jgi:hypothetical protein